MMIQENWDESVQTDVVNFLRQIIRQHRLQRLARLRLALIVAEDLRGGGVHGSDRAGAVGNHDAGEIVGDDPLQDRRDLARLVP